MRFDLIYLLSKGLHNYYNHKIIKLNDIRKVIFSPASGGRVKPRSDLKRLFLQPIKIRLMIKLTLLLLKGKA